MRISDSDYSYNIGEKKSFGEDYPSSTLAPVRNPNPLSVVQDNANKDDPTAVVLVEQVKEIKKLKNDVEIEFLKIKESVNSYEERLKEQGNSFKEDLDSYKADYRKDINDQRNLMYGVVIVLAVAVISLIISVTYGYWEYISSDSVKYQSNMSDVKVLVKAQDDDIEELKNQNEDLQEKNEAFQKVIFCLKNRKYWEMHVCFDGR